MRTRVSRWVLPLLTSSSLAVNPPSLLPSSRELKTVPCHWLKKVQRLHQAPQILQQGVKLRRHQPLHQLWTHLQAWQWQQSYSYPNLLAQDSSKTCRARVWTPVQWSLECTQTVYHLRILAATRTPTPIPSTSRRRSASSLSLKTSKNSRRLTQLKPWCRLRRSAGRAQTTWPSLSCLIKSGKLNWIKRLCLERKKTRTISSLHRWEDWEYFWIRSQKTTSIKSSIS